MGAPGDTKGATIEATGAPARLTTTAATTTTTTPITRMELCALVVKLVRELSAVRTELEATKAELDVAVDELVRASGYKPIVIAAMTQLHEQHVALTRERASRFRLLEDYRALRGKGPTAR